MIIFNPYWGYIIFQNINPYWGFIIFQECKFVSKEDTDTQTPRR